MSRIVDADSHFIETALVRADLIGPARRDRTACGVTGEAQDGRGNAAFLPGRGCP